MLFHVCDVTFKRLSQAQKRINYFAENTGQTDCCHPLEIAFSNMKLAWPIEEDYLEQLILIDWLSKIVNKFCDENKISEDSVAKRVMYDILKDGYFWCDFTYLTSMIKH